MENYTLKDDETILFRSTAILLPDGKRDPKNEKSCDLSLTNQNILVKTSVKKLFKAVQETEVYALQDVKVIDEDIQVIRRKSTVDVYIKEKELYLEFENEKSAKEFCDKALKQISGFSKFVRAVKKTQKVIKETNEALDIDIGKIAQNAAFVASEVTVEVATMGTGKKAKAVSKIAEMILKKKPKPEEGAPALESKEPKNAIMIDSEEN